MSKKGLSNFHIICIPINITTIEIELRRIYIYIYISSARAIHSIHSAFTLYSDDMTINLSLSAADVARRQKS